MTLEELVELVSVALRDNERIEIYVVVEVRRPPRKPDPEPIAAGRAD